MDASLEKTLNKYLQAREELKSQKPEAWKEVVTLCNNVPETVDLQTIWMFGRDKPCWSNIKVAGGERIAQDIFESTDFDAFKTIAGDEWGLVKTGRGRANKLFEAKGNSVKKFLDRLGKGGLKSYQWKLYSIRQLALALADEHHPIHELTKELISNQFIDHQRVGPWTKKFQKCAGFGWGYITANHMLADLGLSIKPDLHVRRAGVRLGMTVNTPTTLTNAQIDKLPAKVDYEIVVKALQIAEVLSPIARTGVSGTFKNKIALREMDKAIMEWSRQDLSRPL
jgi:hypothetical protein